MFLDCRWEDAPVSLSYDPEARAEDILSRRSNAAGFRSSRELSSFSGDRHFWQCISSSCYGASYSLEYGSTQNHQLSPLIFAHLDISM